MQHLEQNEPSLQAQKQWLAWYLVAQCLGEPAGHLLGVMAPLAPHMLKQLLCQLRHNMQHITHIAQPELAEGVRWESMGVSLCLHCTLGGVPKQVLLSLPADS